MPAHSGYLEGYQKICSQANGAFGWVSSATTKYPGTVMDQQKDAILFGMKLCFWPCKKLLVNYNKAWKAAEHVPYIV